ncbi:MAG TPA: SUF system NifU family Fe-S cluster assembly protein [Gemmatimonadaceae bacterium]|jgi:nitrogen fixation NifU-like protein
MADMSELYQSVILDHNRTPRNFGRLPDANRHAEGKNPLCGDELSIWLRLGGDDRIEEVKFEGSGCAISKASASLMTGAVKGKTRAEALDLFTRFHDLVTGEAAASPETLGKLAVFKGVVEFPVRVKCASLSWHTLKAALESPDSTITTE